MLRHAFDSPKLAHLMSLLAVGPWSELPEPFAVGTLEKLWHFTATQAPRGDIGRWSVAQISAGIRWPGSPKQLVDGLVEAKWVDRCKVHGLIVHDWHEHADQTVQRCQKVKSGGFAALDHDHAACMKKETSEPLVPDECPASSLHKPDDCNYDKEKYNTGSLVSLPPAACRLPPAARAGAGAGLLPPEPEPEYERPPGEPEAGSLRPAVAAPEGDPLEPPEEYEEVGPKHALLNLLSKCEGSIEEKRLWLQDSIVQLKIAAADQGKPIRGLVISWYKVYIDRGERKWRDCAQLAAARAEAAELRAKLGAGIEELAGDNR